MNHRLFHVLTRPPEIQNKNKNKKQITSTCYLLDFSAVIWKLISVQKLWNFTKRLTKSHFFEVICLKYNFCITCMTLTLVVCMQTHKGVFHYWVIFWLLPLHFSVFNLTVGSSLVRYNVHQQHGAHLTLFVFGLGIWMMESVKSPKWFIIIHKDRKSGKLFYQVWGASLLCQG